MHLKELQMRWREEQVCSALLSLSDGKAISPFGFTVEGRIDLRGLITERPLILNGLSMNGVDLSYSRIAKLLCIRCDLTDWVFNNAKLALLSNATKIGRSQFIKSKLATSGSVGETEFNECIFEKADLTGCIFKEGSFVACSFNDAKLARIEFGTCEIMSSSFNGLVEKSFFRGNIYNTDFSRVVFLNCAFYGVEFHQCLFSDDALLFKDWSVAFTIIRDAALNASLTHVGREAIQRWVRVWSELAGEIKQELVDKKSLQLHEGEQVGEELFAFLRSSTESLR